MTRVVCFKPGVAGSRTAFESMAPIYKYLENHHEYDFTLITASSDTFEDDQLDIVSLPDSTLRHIAWQVFKYVGSLPVSPLLPSNVNRHFENADAVITVDPTSRAAGVIGIQKAVSAETPVWFDAGRTTVRPFTGHWWNLRRRVFTDAVRETDGIIVTSPKVFEYFRDIGLFTDKTAEKFTVMGHPTDTELFSPPTDGQSNPGEGLEVLTISRLVPEKGLYYLLEAIDPILSNRDDVTLTILGKGPMEPVLKREIRDRDIADSIRIKGTVPHSQIPSLLQDADIFVNHAVDIARWEEFFGAVNIEAMACELPCIVSDSGSIPYVARVPDGVELVAQRDVVALRESLQKLIDSPELRTQMGEIARRFVEEEYSIAAIGEKYHRMLQEGIESPLATASQSK